MNPTYTNISTKTWTKILREDCAQWQRPISVHIPIHPAHSRDFVHVDTAFNVCRRRNYPDLSCYDADAYKAVKDAETFAVQLAFDDPPFQPDFRLTDVSLDDGRLQVVKLAYYAWDIYYEVEYFCVGVGDSGQTALWVNGRVTNEGEDPAKGTVWVKPNFNRESDLFPDYHYVPFHWNARRWISCDRVSLNGQSVLLDGKPVGAIESGGFDCEWVEHASFEDSDYNVRFGCGSPYFVESSMRFAQLDNVIRLSSDLAPGESAEFAVAIAVDYENSSETLVDKIRGAGVIESRAQAVSHFSGLTENNTRVQCEAGGRGKLMDAMVNQIHQLLVQFPDRTYLTPTQGGTSERYFVWVWEAVCMLKPLLRTGHF